MPIAEGLILLVFFQQVVALVGKKRRVKMARESAGKHYDKFVRVVYALMLVNIVLIMCGTKNGPENFYFLPYAFGVLVITHWRRDKTLGWPDLFLAAWICVPIQLRWVNGGWGGGITSYMLTTFSASILMLTGVFTLRPNDPDLGWKFEKRDFVWIGLALLALIPAVVLPAWLVKFVDPHLTKDWKMFPLAFLEIWFATALFEELLFRGMLQKILVRYLKPSAGILLASAIFGLYHITRTAGSRHFPNWWYVLFASIAGIAYGVVGYKRNLQSAIMTHCCVDFIWWLFLKWGK